MLDQVNRRNASLQQVAHWMSDAPARVWDIVDKGRIEVGFDADLVLVDMQQQQTIRNESQVTKCGWESLAWHNASRMACWNPCYGTPRILARPLGKAWVCARGRLRPPARRLLGRLVHPLTWHYSFQYPDAESRTMFFIVFTV